MKKLMLRSTGLSVMFFLVVIASSLESPAYAGCGCGLPQTTYDSGMAETCEDALADLHARLDELVLCPNFGFSSYCSSYAGPVVVTSDCYYNGMGGAWWKYDGYRTYRCTICTSLPDI